MSDETNLSARPELGPLPLVIGVVGRCPCPGDQEAFKQQARYILQTRVTELYSNTPLILLSTLAEGANQLVVDVALECGAELIVPLPMPERHYAADFTDIARFNFLRDKASRFFELKSDLVSGFTEATITDKDGTHRNIQYALADAYIARHCQILIALHDRAPRTDQRVTIEHIIEFKLNGRFDRDPALELDKKLLTILDKAPEPYWLRRSALYPPESGPVYPIVVPPAAGAQPSPLFPEEFEDDQPKAEKFYARIHKHVQTFNAHAIVKDDPGLEEFREIGKDPLLEDAEVKANGLSEPLKKMRECYQQADVLAMYFQSKTNRMLTFLCVLAFVAAASFIAYAHLLVHHAAPWPLAVYFFMLAVAFRFYFEAQRRDYQNKYQDYRAVAEGLRVQFFWRLAGVDSSAAEYYLLKQTSELDWIRNVIAACSVRAAPERTYNWPLIHERWIKHQHDYFSSRTGTSRKTLIAYKYIGEGFLLVSLSLAILVLIVYLMEKLAHIFSEPAALAHEVPGLVMAILITSVLVFFLYALSKHIIEQYENLREEAVPEEDATRKSGPGDGADNPRTQLKRDVQELTERPKSSLALGIGGGLLLAAIILLAPSLISFWPRLDLKPDVHELWIVAIGLTAVAGGLLHYHSEKRALAEHAKQYGRMTIIFKNALERFKKFEDSGDYGTAAALVKELGIEALAENGDWVLLHRERPVEPIRSMEG